MSADCSEPFSRCPVANFSYSPMKGPTRISTRPSTPPLLEGVPAPPAAISASASASSFSRATYLRKGGGAGRMMAEASETRQAMHSAAGCGRQGKRHKGCME
eukprot:scaffold107004_cov33-Tisochrysis_lutea.AAC.4